MHFSSSTVNESADENEIPFPAEKRKRKSPVPIYYRTQLRFSCEHDIFGPIQMTFLERKRKILQKFKIRFRPKAEKAENDQMAHFRRRKRKRISVGF